MSGVTKSGRVWRKVPESDARSVEEGAGKRCSESGVVVGKTDARRRRHGSQLALVGARERVAAFPRRRQFPRRTDRARDDYSLTPSSITG